MLISIHAPHTGRDFMYYNNTRKAEISIHAPHTGRDECPSGKRTRENIFQSTRPIRGATRSR